MNLIVRGDFRTIFKMLEDESVDAIYTDPPFNTGKKRIDPRDQNVAYSDSYAEGEWLQMMHDFAIEAQRVLKSSGSVYLHLDWRGVYQAKLHVMDDVFGNENFLGDIVWGYDWGARSKSKFSRKHDNILHYAKDVEQHRFDPERVDRVPYKAPELQMYRAKRLGKDDGAQRIEAGKPVTDVFSDINVLGTSSKERALNSYPTMKPTKLVKRLLSPIVTPGCVVLDPFCGSGVAVEAAHALDCSFVVGDANPVAALIASRRAEHLGIDFTVVER